MLKTDQYPVGNNPFPEKKTKLEGPISHFRIATITVHYSMFCVCIHVDIIFSFV